MERTALRFAQLEKLNRQLTELLIVAASVFVVFLAVGGWLLAIGFGVVALLTYRLSTELRKAMGFASKSDYKRFKFSLEGASLGIPTPAQMSDPFFVDPAVASPALQKLQQRRLTARKISFIGGITSGSVPLVMLVAGISVGSTVGFSSSTNLAELAAVIWIALFVIWGVALIAAFGGLFAAFAARLKIQRLVIFGG
jgi:hypothetical protein